MHTPFKRIKMSRKKHILTYIIFLSFLLSFFTQGIAYSQQWIKVYGGSGYDWSYSIKETSDGGYIAVGYTNSFGAGSGDILVIKLNNDGSVAWQKTYGGSADDWARNIQQTTDGGYIIAGYSYSFGAGSGDAWVLKLAGDGSVQWEKTYGGAGSDRVNFIQQTADGGYVAAGRTISFGTGSGDIWVLKLNTDGSPAWQKTYGGSGDDWARYVHQTSDGGYLVAGYTPSFGAGDDDVWILRLDNYGSVVWEKTYGGVGTDRAYFVQQMPDGRLMAVGMASSFGAGSGDFWILNMREDGSVIWEKTYGGAGYDRAYSLQQTPDGGYIVAGRTSSFGYGVGELWMIKLGKDGTVLWEKTYGGINFDRANAVELTSDGGYIMAGYTYTFGSGNSDAWVLKVDGIGEIAGCFASGTSNALVNQSNAVINSSNAVITATNVNANNSFAAGTSASVAVTELCYYNGPYSLTINKDGAGSGTVTSVPGSIDCGSACSAIFNGNTEVTLTTTADGNSFFAGWGGDKDCGDGITIMDMNKSCTAFFNHKIEMNVLPDFVLIPAGGTLGYSVKVTNSTDTHQCFDYWTHVILPNGSPYPKGGELLGPYHLCLNGYTSRTVHINTHISVSAPPGIYTYNVFVGPYPNVWNENQFDFTVTTPIP